MSKMNGLLYAADVDVQSAKIMDTRIRIRKTCIHMYFVELGVEVTCVHLLMCGYIILADTL